MSTSSRWEFRAFGADFGRAEHRIRSHENLLRRESSETYIVCTRSPHNVKIRDGLLELKVLDEVGPHHLERWSPGLISGFPLSREDCRSMLDVLHAADVELTADRYSLEQLLRGVVQPAPRLHTVRVTKVRETFVIDACTVEIVAVTFEGEPLRSLAVEHEDPEALWSAVQDLEMGHLENVNYVEAMKRSLKLRPSENPS